MTIRDPSVAWAEVMQPLPTEAASPVQQLLDLEISEEFQSEGRLPSPFTGIVVAMGLGVLAWALILLVWWVLVA